MVWMLIPWRSATGNVSSELVAGELVCFGVHRHYLDPRFEGVPYRRLTRGTGESRIAEGRPECAVLGVLSFTTFGDAPLCPPKSAYRTLLPGPSKPGRGTCEVDARSMRGDSEPPGAFVHGEPGRAPNSVQPIPLAAHRFDLCAETAVFLGLLSELRARSPDGK